MVCFGEGMRVLGGGCVSEEEVLEKHTCPVSGGV